LVAQILKKASEQHWSCLPKKPKKGGARVEITTRGRADFHNSTEKRKKPSQIGLPEKKELAVGDIVNSYEITSPKPNLWWKTRDFSHPMTTFYDKTQVVQKKEKEQKYFEV
jgi:hypothetical protein